MISGTRSHSGAAHLICGREPCPRPGSARRALPAGNSNADQTNHDYDRYARYTRLFFDRPHPRVLRVTMGDRPERLNAVDAVMHRELGEIWRDIDADPEVNSVIITGAGRGVLGRRRLRDDRGDDGRLRDPGSGFTEGGRAISSTTSSTAASRWLARCAGRPWGPGWCAGCWRMWSIASKDARIIDGHTRLGVAAGSHSVIVWPLLCGLAKAKYYLLLCDAVSGAEAERIGLVSLAVDDAELDAKALEVATRLAEGAQSAIPLDEVCAEQLAADGGAVVRCVAGVGVHGVQRAGGGRWRGWRRTRRSGGRRSPPGSSVLMETAL